MPQNKRWVATLRPMEIPHDQLSVEAPEGLIEEFVTRDGTDLRDAEGKGRQVREHLRRGLAAIVFDEESESCTIVTREEMARTPPPQAGRGGPRFEPDEIREWEE